MNAPRLRTMREADLPRVLEIERSCFSTPWSDATFRGLLRRNDCDMYVAEVDEEVAGYAVFWAVADQGELGNLAIAPGFRRRGLGRMLLDAILSRAGERSVRELYLEVRTSNELARRLYEARGFREVGRRRNYYSEPVEDALVLCRKIGAE